MAAMRKLSRAAQRISRYFYQLYSLGAKGTDILRVLRYITINHRDNIIELNSILDTIGARLMWELEGSWRVIMSAKVIQRQTISDS